jgi:hypothetical protein
MIVIIVMIVIITGNKASEQRVSFQSGYSLMQLVRLVLQRLRRSWFGHCDISIFSTRKTTCV